MIWYFKIEMLDREYQVLLPEPWTEEDVKNHYRCHFDRDKHIVTVSLVDIAGDEVHKMDYDSRTFGTEVIDLSFADTIC